MKYLSIFDDFMNEEFSRNEPIKEIFGDKVAVFMVGPAASGKSTMLRDIVLRKNRTFNVLDPDTKSKILTKHLDKIKSSFKSRVGYDKYYNTILKKVETHTRIKGISRELSKQFIASLAEGRNLIFDSTGRNKELLSFLSERAKSNGYKVIFIHVLSEGISWSINQAQQRADMTGRPVDKDYLVLTYEETQKLIKYYGNLDQTDNYYVVVNRSDRSPVFYKYHDGELHKRKRNKWKGVVSKQLVEHMNFGPTNSDRILYAFDIDNTLVKSPKFSDMYENGLPDPSSEMGGIIDDELQKVNATREDVQIIDRRITIPSELAPNWDINNGRSIMPKPQAFFTTAESLGTEYYPEIKKIYDSAKFKTIITGRNISLYDKVDKNLDDLGFDPPNKGLYLSPTYDEIGKWKSSILEGMLDKYDKIYYYEDKLSWIKHMRNQIKSKNLIVYHVTDGKIIGQY